MLLYHRDPPSHVLASRAPIALALAGLMSLLSACADTGLGQKVEGFGLTALDPANASSQAILGSGDQPTILSGRAGVESSIADADGWRETNLGAQPKVRRYSRVELADGKVVALYESNPANEELGELVLKAPGGSFESLTVKGRNTDLSTVQREIVAYYQAVLPAFIKGTEAQRDAIIRKLEAQENVSKAAAEQLVPMLNAVRLMLGGI